MITNKIYIQLAFTKYKLANWKIHKNTNQESFNNYLSINNTLAVT